jgi:hypothetical protein
MSRKQNLYLGKAGQLLVMSEFLARGWNVATPEVDIGDDLFVVEDKQGIFFRVQVKTASAIVSSQGYATRFKLPIKQIKDYISPEIYFIFVIRINNSWQNVMIISRESISKFIEDDSFGSKIEGNILLNFVFKKDKVFCSNVDFTEFINNFEDFPIINH